MHSQSMSAVKIVTFNMKQFEERGFSYGFAVIPGLIDQKIWVGTNFRSSPVVNAGAVELDLLEPASAFCHGPITDDKVTKGSEIMVNIQDGPRGLWAKQWCFKSEWDSAISYAKELSEKRKRAEEAERRAAAIREAQLVNHYTVNPRTIEQAVRYGWKIKSDDGRQVIVSRINDKGKEVSKTFCRPKSRGQTKTRKPVPQHA